MINLIIIMILVIVIIIMAMIAIDKYLSASAGRCVKR